MTEITDYITGSPEINTTRCKCLKLGPKRYLIMRPYYSGRTPNVKFTIEEQFIKYYPIEDGDIKSPDLITTVLAEEDVYHKLDRKDALLIQLSETAPQELFDQAMTNLFYNHIVNPEIHDYFNNEDHKPMFLEIWANEFFMEHIDYELGSRQHLVEEVHNS